MFRIFSSSPRSRRAAIRRSTPTLQCGFARRTHETPSQSVDLGTPYATSGISGTAGAGFLQISGFNLADFNPVKFLQDVMKNDGETTRFKLDLSPRFFILSIIAVVVFSTVMTLVFATKGVTKGYVLRDLEIKSQGLVRQNEVMTMQLAEAKSLDTVVHNDVLLNMRPAKQIVYMSGSNAIASR